MLRNLPFFLNERRLLDERWRLFSLSLILIAASWSCSLNHPGEAPSEGELYYPIAVAIPPVQEDEADSGVPPRYLFVVNTNFDLRYNAGSVQAFDLDAIAERINDCDPSEQCRIDSPADVLADEVLIGSFAATATFSPTGKRLYVPTRSNSSLTYIDVDLDAKNDAILSCGEGSGRRCGDDYVRGDESIASERELEITGESIGAVAARLTALADKEALSDTDNREDFETIDGILVAQRNGTVSFFTSRDKKDKGIEAGPQLVYMVENFDRDLTNIALDPVSGSVYLTSQETATTGGFKSLQRVRFYYDKIEKKADLNTSFIYNAGSVYLRGVDLERDTRDIAFSPLAEDNVFVVSRTPNALLIVDFSEARAGALEAYVSRTVKVGSGASRLALGQIGDDPRLFAFVSCFGSRELYIIDVELAEPVAVIQGFSGPFEVVVDRWRKLAYVADFRSSIIRIVDLQPIVCVPESYGVECPEEAADVTDPIPCKCFSQPSRIVATLGDPHPPEELI